MTASELTTQLNKTHSSKKNILYLIFFIFLIAVVSFAAWMINEKINSRWNEIDKIQQSLHEQLTQNQQASEKLETKMGMIQAQLAQEHTFLQQFTSAALDKKVVLAEANHLAKLAYYNLVFSQDIPMTINLLEASDEKIAKLNDPSLLNVRQLLAQNIADLKAVPQIDLPGLLTRIHTLQTQISQLPVILPAEKTLDQTTPDKSALPPWRRKLENSLLTIQKLIVIRRTDKKISPLLPAVQQAYLQQNIQLLLQQAQWAVLRRQQSIYQNSLDQAKNLVEQHFAVDSPITQSLLQTLSDLSKMNIAPALPNILPTVEKLSRSTQPYKGYA
jgi:uroporphyrin-3 C-methyltransferase